MNVSVSRARPAADHDEPVVDLRSALALLADIPGQLLSTGEPVEPLGELAGVYRHIGAGGTVRRPTRLGPAMLFNQVKGFPGWRVAVGVLASRERVAHLLGTTPERLGFDLNDALQRPLPPVTVGREAAPCQQVVHRADAPGFDLRRLLPAPTTTPEDAGPYVTMGLAYAADPETGDSDVTIHRLCIQGPDEMTIFFCPDRHIDVFRARAEAAGRPLPISISIGLDPAIGIAACFEPPATPLGMNELGIAGGLRRRPVELVRCLSVDCKAVANAEVVIEGEILPGVRMAEDRATGSGKAMPEFPGYTGPAVGALPVIKVRAVTHRRRPIMQTVIGPSEEHVNLAGIPTEASIIAMVERAMPGRLKTVYAHPAGGGKYLAVLQFEKRCAADEGRQRQAALIAFAAFSELKQVILVDEDVDPFDTNDVLWAMTTRYQGDVSTVFIPGVRCHPLDPSQSPAFNPLLRGEGITCKTIFDCTVPYALKAEFRRAEFQEVDVERFLRG